MNNFWALGTAILAMATPYVSATASAADFECSRDGIRSSMIEKRGAFLVFLKGVEDPQPVLEEFQNEFKALQERDDYESTYAELESLDENPDQQPSPELCERVQESGEIVDNFIESNSGR
ncbi:hypothetical protein KZO83_09340 [Chromohalobacter sp. TMW 2.2308]|uniref:hypothetical protein n=1 Tax=Chromohalobacter TaxID=42054 RepID=UPI001FFC5D84|nr:MULTISPECIES: hypothetical protein [Chromohalobacter]MCK2042897.1 hypothetical protein [Chromohalobacter moromii]MCT8514583.1 hypothetical protein [Chromohalobacter sp. TMW 2.2271]